MDDLTVTTLTKTPVGAKWVLVADEEVVTWARIEFKTKKSRCTCIVIKKGRVKQG
jgi:hypothetical protein